MHCAKRTRHNERPYYQRKRNINHKILLSPKTENEEYTPIIMNICKSVINFIRMNE